MSAHPGSGFHADTRRRVSMRVTGQRESLPNFRQVEAIMIGVDVVDWP
jgi:hypothetical protein